MTVHDSDQLDYKIEAYIISSFIKKQKQQTSRKEPKMIEIKPHP